MNKPEHIYSIDSLKGLACCVIAFFWHYQNFGSKHVELPLYYFFKPFYDYGQYFVELFFMISGFVMAYCYKEKIINGENFFLYIKKRYKHLYPLFFITLMVTALLQVFYKHITGDYYKYVCDLYHFFLNLLCIQTGWVTTDQSFNGPAWCISVEVFLYILFYITTYFTKKDKKKYLLVNLFCCFIAVIFIFLEPSHEYSIFNMFMLRGIACFYAGVLISELNFHWTGNKKKNMAKGAFLLSICFSIGICLFYSLYWKNENYGRLGLILVQFPVLLFASINFIYLKKILEIKFLVYLGIISLDIYLWHTPVQILIRIIDQVFFFNLNYSSLAVWIFYVFSVFIVAVISSSYKQIKEYSYLKKIAIAIMLYFMIDPIIDLLGMRMYSIYTNSMNYSDNSACIELKKESKIQEVFYAKENGKLKKIKFYTITWGKRFSQEDNLTIKLKEESTNEVLYSIVKPMSTFKDGRVYEISVDDIFISGDKWYVLEFIPSIENEKQIMALMLTKVSDNQAGYAIIDGSKLQEHIASEIIIK